MNYFKNINKDIIETFYIDNKVFICNYNDIFRDVIIDGKKTRYIVDIMSNIYNKKTGKKLVPILSSGGYYRVQLTTKKYHAKSYSVHRITAIAFIPNPENKPDVNHKDGKKYHNYATNLEWVTKSENIIHAYNNNLKIKPKGEINPKAKLSYDDVEKIWKIITDKNNDLSFKEIGDLFHVSKSTISHIYNGDTWSDLYNKYHTNETPKKDKKYSDETIKIARKLINDGIPIKNISVKTGINKKLSL